MNDVFGKEIGLFREIINLGNKIGFTEGTWINLNNKVNLEKVYEFLYGRANIDGLPNVLKGEAVECSEKFGGDYELMWKVMILGRELGFEARSWAMMVMPKVMKEIKIYLDGKKGIQSIPQIVDQNWNTVCPDGWTVIYHKGIGSWDVRAQEINFFQSKKFLDLKEADNIDEHVMAYELWAESFSKGKLLDAAAWAYFRDNRDLAEKIFKGREALFLGTVYKTPRGKFVIRRWVTKTMHDETPGFMELNEWIGGNTCAAYIK